MKKGNSTVKPMVVLWDEKMAKKKASVKAALMATKTVHQKEPMWGSKTDQMMVKS